MNPQWSMSPYTHQMEGFAADGGRHASIITRCRVAWSKFRELLPILSTQEEEYTLLV